MFIHLVVVRTPRRHILQVFKEAKTDEVSGFLIRFHERLFQKLEDAACLIEILFFVYVLDDEMNKFSHIVVGARWISTPTCDVLLPTVGEIREGFSRR